MHGWSLDEWVALSPEARAFHEAAYFERLSNGV